MWEGWDARKWVFLFFFFFSFKCGSLYFLVVVSPIVISPLSNKIHYFFHAVLQCDEASAWRTRHDYIWTMQTHEWAPRSCTCRLNPWDVAAHRCNKRKIVGVCWVDETQSRSRLNVNVDNSTTMSQTQWHVNYRFMLGFVIFTCNIICIQL